jgi:hypothetical protein
MRDEPYETFQVGDLTVEIYPDTDPSSPEDSHDESLFFVCWSRGFSTKCAGFDCLSDFSDFVHPRKLDESEVDSYIRESVEPVGDKPARRDEMWMMYYAENTQEIEQLLLEAGQEIEPCDKEAIRAADHNLEERQVVWYEWSRYKAAHAEYACFGVHVANYGGGSFQLTLGEVWDGEDGEEYGRRGVPEGMIRIKRDAGWRTDMEAVAKSVVDEWNQYLSGDVWGYVIKDEEGEELDSCWGYYGRDHCEQSARESAIWLEEHRQKQLKIPFPQPLTESNG